MYNKFGSKLKIMSEIFNKFRSGSETIQDALKMKSYEYDTVLHDERELKNDEIDKLVELGFSLSWILDRNPASEVCYEE